MISVIIPAYNSANTITYTIESILNQSYKDFEIIIVDDGSTDNLDEVLRHSNFEFEKIKIVHQDNSGVSKARNKGLDIAQGCYVTFVDADDTINCDAFKIAVGELERGFDFVQYNYVCVYNGVPAKTFKYIEEDITLNDKNAMIALLFDKKNLLHNSVATKIFRREVLENIRFDESIKISEDEKFTFEVICNSKKAKLMSYEGYNYIQYVNSATHQNLAEKNFDVFKTIEFYESHTTDEKILKLLELKRIDLAFGIATRMYDEADENFISTHIQYLKECKWSKYTVLYLKQLSLKKQIKFILLFYFNPVYAVINRFRRNERKTQR